MPQDIPVTCDSCGKKFSIKHTLSCPKGGIVLVQHDDVVKEWVALGARALVPSAVSYEMENKQYDSTGGEERGRSVAGR